MVNLCPSCGVENTDTAKFCNECGKSLSEKENTGNGKPFTLSKGVTLRGRYTIELLIKAGGMGAVYKAEDQNLSKVCAVKELWPYWVGSGEERDYMIKKFEIEAKLLSQLHHKSLPRVIDYFTSDERYYLVMDFVEGYDLDSLIRKEGNPGLSKEKILPWAIEVCEVLEYLHNHAPPIIYRDLKPSNIMVRISDNQIVLIDFGIACVIQNEVGGAPRTTIGTMGYIAPEQYLGKPVLASDIYSLGATLYHLLTGNMPVPFDYKPMSSIVQDIPALLEEVVQACLTLNLADRIQKAADVKLKLGAVLREINLSSTSEIPRAGLRDTLIIRIPPSLSEENFLDEPEELEEFIEDSEVDEFDERDTREIKKASEVKINGRYEEDFFDEDFIDRSFVSEEYEDEEDFQEVELTEEEFINELSVEIVNGIFEAGEELNKDYLKELPRREVSYKIAEKFIEGLEEDEIPEGLSRKYVSEKIGEKLVVEFQKKLDENRLDIKNKEQEDNLALKQIQENYEEGFLDFSGEDSAGEAQSIFKEDEDFLELADDDAGTSPSPFEEDFIDFSDSSEEAEQVPFEEDFVELSEEAKAISVEEDFIDLSDKIELLELPAAEEDFIDFSDESSKTAQSIFKEEEDFISFSECNSKLSITSFEEDFIDLPDSSLLSGEEDFIEILPDRKETYTKVTVSNSIDLDEAEFASLDFEGFTFLDDENIKDLKIDESLIGNYGEDEKFMSADDEKESEFVLNDNLSDKEKACQYFEKAQELIGQKQFQNAVDFCEKALELDAEFLDVYYTLGSIYKKVNRSALAVDAYKKYLSLKQKKNREKIKARSASIKNKDFSKDKKNEQIKEVLTGAGDKAAGKNKIIGEAGLAEIEKKPVLKGEIKDGKVLPTGEKPDSSNEKKNEETNEIRLVKRKPSKVRLGLGLKKTIFKKDIKSGQFEKEKKGKDTVRSKESSGNKKRNKKEEIKKKLSVAKKYSRKGQFTLAIGEYENVLKNNPELSILYINLGEVYKKLGEFSLAIDNYKKYLELKPDNIDINFELALLYKIKGNKELAIMYFDKCIKLDPDSSLAKRAAKYIKEFK